MKSRRRVDARPFPDSKAFQGDDRRDVEDPHQARGENQVALAEVAGDHEDDNADHPPAAFQ